MDQIQRITAASYSDPGFLANDNYLGDFPGLNESFADDGPLPVYIDIDGFIDLCETTATHIIESTGTQASMSRTECVLMWMGVLAAKVSEVQHRSAGRQAARQQRYELPKDSGDVPGIIARAIESLGYTCVAGLHIYPTMTLPGNGGNAPDHAQIMHLNPNVNQRCNWSPAAYLAANPLPAARLNPPVIVFNLNDLGGWLGIPPIQSGYFRWVGRVRKSYRTWAIGPPAKGITYEQPRSWMMPVTQNDKADNCQVMSVAPASLAEYAEAYVHRFMTPLSIEATIYRFETQAPNLPAANAGAAAINAWQQAQNLNSLNSRYRRLASGPYLTPLIGGRSAKIGSILSKNTIIYNII